MSHLSLESNRFQQLWEKHANCGFQLRQVQHGSASGVEAPLFDSPEGVTDHEGPCAWATKPSQGWEKEGTGSLGGFGCQLDGKGEILLPSSSQLEGTHHTHNSSQLCPFCTNPIPKRFGAAQNGPWQGCWNPGISVSFLG